MRTTAWYYHDQYRQQSESAWGLRRSGRRAGLWRRESGRTAAALPAGTPADDCNDDDDGLAARLARSLMILLQVHLQ